MRIQKSEADSSPGVWAMAGGWTSCAYIPSSFTIVKLLLSVAAERDLPVILLDVRCVCVCLYGLMQRNLYIEPPRQDEKLSHGGSG